MRENFNKKTHLRKIIDGFKFNECEFYGLHKDGILSRHETPLEGAAIESWNNVDFNEFGITVQKSA